MVSASACHVEDHGFKPRYSRQTFWQGSSKVEQRSHNPCVVGSIPSLATLNNYKHIIIGV